jgi:NitT/TauT family transport system substrate-binding protein
LAEVLWVTLPDSSIKTLADFRRKRIGYTAPQSTTQAPAFMLLDAAGIRPDEVQLLAAGDFPQALSLRQFHIPEIEGILIEPVGPGAPGENDPMLCPRPSGRPPQLTRRRRAAT